MGFLVSPGVDVNEIDMTNVIPAISTSIGGYAGPFRWGPVDQIVTVSSEKDLVSVYGKPDAIFAQSFFTAASFLKYGNSLKVSRAFTLTGSLITVGTPSVSTVTVSATANAVIAAANTALNTAGNTTRAVSSVMTATSITITDSITVGTVKTIRELTRTYTGVSSDITAPTALIITTITVLSATITNKLVYSAFTSLEESGSPLIITSTGYTLTTTQTTTSNAVTSTIFNALSGVAAAAAPATSSVFIKASDNFDQLNIIPTPVFVARHAGSLGNSLKVVIVNSYTSIDNEFARRFDYRPEGENEFHMLIIDTLGEFSGTTGSILERYVGLSTLATDKRVDGTSNYYMSVLNFSSSYVYAGAGLTLTNTDTAKIFLFGGGVESTAEVLSTAAVDNALGLFDDTQTVDVNLIFAYGTSDSSSPSAGETKLQLIASTRKDCVAFISAPITISSSTSEFAKLSLITTKFSGSLTRNSYSVFDSSPLYIYNKYLDNYLWIPACGHMAGLCANTDDVAEPWFSPAGYTRGQLFGVTKLGFNPNLASRDTMYKLGVNPICAFPGQGIILFGDKTAQAKPSAFDRINVRRLFIVLEKAIATASKYQLFELNDEFTRAMFRNMVEPFLRDVKGRRGITDFLVVCDETNNTGEVIDTNRFVADIYIKPARSINFITLNFIATRTGVEFSEIAGK